jgi:prolipoprotein diacylglyceryltransferase
VEFTLLWAGLTGVLFAWAGTRIWSERLPDHPTDRMVGAGAVGLFIGRLAAMISQGINPVTNPLDIIIVRGGVHSGFAAIGAVTAYLWAGKWRYQYLDATAPAALFGLAGWHTGCIWREACLGTPSSLPWAWASSGSIVTRHPVEIYAAIAFAAAAFLVAKLPWDALTRSGAALGSAGAIRLLTEPMRLSITGGPVVWYATATLLGLVVAVVGRRFFPNPGHHST